MKKSKIFLLAITILLVAMTSCESDNKNANPYIQIISVKRQDKLYVLIEGGVHDTLVNNYKDTDPMEYHLREDVLENKDDDHLCNKVILFRVVSSKIIDQPAN
jgi:hypothetical protein